MRHAQLARVCLNISRRKHTMNRLFEDANHAKDYAKFRPHYPQAVYETIQNYCSNEDNKHSLAIDLCCGFGNSTAPLSNYYNTVIGSDISEAQLNQAPCDIPNLRFKLSSAEDLSWLEDCSVDLITCAQGLHWLNRDVVYSEVKRVLRKGGAFVAYGYGLCTLDTPEGTELIRQYHTNDLCNWWNPARTLVDTLYQDMHPLPFNQAIRNDIHTIEKVMEVGELISYLGTSSAYQQLKKANPDTLLLTELHNRLFEISNRHSQKGIVTVSWPIFMLMGQN